MRPRQLPASVLRPRGSRREQSSASRPSAVGLVVPGPGVEPSVFVRFKDPMKSEQGRGFEIHGATQHPARIQKQGPEPQEQPLHGTQIGRSPPRAVDDQKLVFEEEAYSTHRFGAPPRPSSWPRWSSNARAAPINLSSRENLTHGLPQRQDRQTLNARISNSPFTAFPDHGNNMIIVIF